MKKQILTTSIALTAALLWGCEKGPNSSTQEASGQSTTEAAKVMVDNTVTAVKEESAEIAESASAITDATVQKAQSLLDQATQYINEGRLDLAEEIMTQLANLRDSLPESLQTQIDNLQSMFAAKQSAEDVTKSTEAAQQLLPGQN